MLEAGQIRSETIRCKLVVEVQSDTVKVDRKRRSDSSISKFGSETLVDSFEHLPAAQSGPVLGGFQSAQITVQTRQSSFRSAGELQNSVQVAFLQFVALQRLEVLVLQ